MGIRNYLVEGVSGTGKTSVCDELLRRGYQAIHGDRELAYQGDPETGEPTEDVGHEHHIWRVDRVRTLVADQHEPVTFFCGGSRNFAAFLDLFDGVFVLDVDLDTLNRRLEQRVDDWGEHEWERELIRRLHRTKEDIPAVGTVIDATAPLEQVVDEILRHVSRPGPQECLACDLLSGSVDLPGGVVLATPRWRVEHCVGPLPVGTLVVKPLRHVLRLADLDDAEAAELGPLLRKVSRTVGELSGAPQVYTGLWSSGPVHIHFVVQPETPALVRDLGARGPALQAALFARGDRPDRAAVEAFAADARRALAEAPD